MTGGTGADQISGNKGNDVLKGGNANDVVDGGEGDDDLYGDAGDDIVDGGDGNDTIHGGAGNDELTGWNGKDTFVFEASNNGVDTITDFTVGVDGDVLKFANSTALAGTAAIQDVAAAPASAVTFATAASNVLEFSFDLAGNGVSGKDLDDATDGANLLSALGQGINVGLDGAKGVLVAYQSGNAYVYTAADTAANTEVALTAGEIQLVGVLQNVTVGGITTDNFANFTA
jgi:hypothetical protein